MFFSCCDNGLADSLQFHQENRGPYVFEWEHVTPQHEMQGNRASSCSEGKSHEFSELLQAPDVYSRVTAGMDI